MHDSDPISLIFGIIICIVLVGILASGVKGSYNILKDAENNTSTEIIPLAAIETKSDIAGRFYLGHANIEETPYYYCYRVNKDSSKELYKMPMDKTKIYETLSPDKQAYAEETRNDLGTITDIKLYVPVNTIQEEYNLSLPQ